MRSQRLRDILQGKEDEVEEDEVEEDENTRMQRAFQKREKYKRNKDQICLNCRFWDFDIEHREGSCYRFPPSVRSGPTNRIDFWGFPEITYDNWCGEWKPVPNKDEYYAVASPIDGIDDEE